MEIRVAPLPAGIYFVATPLGHARDITLRALDVLASADVLAAEDTRTLRHLMEIHGVSLGARKIIAYHEHNGDRQRPKILAALAQGQSVAYASDAGTPMVADPGFTLARAATDQGFAVFAAPGPSALLTALTVSSLPTNRFSFFGFLPNQKSQRLKFLNAARIEGHSLVFFESPRRAPAALADMIAVFGADHPVALCREMTKKFETVLRGSLAEVLAQVEATPVKGEVVLVLGPPQTQEVSQDEIDKALTLAFENNSLKDSVRMVCDQYHLGRKQVYARALELQKR